MMLTLRIAFRNLIAHRRSTLVLFSIFFIVTLIIFWVFGFLNTVDGAIANGYRSIYGDLYFSIDYRKKTELAALLLGADGEGMAAKAVRLEDFPSVMIDFKGKSASDTVRSVLSESAFSMTYVKVSAGRMPSSPAEINVPETFVTGKEWKGQFLYVSSITPEKVMNTIRYEIVGTNKLFFFLSPDGITQLSNGSASANVISIDLAEILAPREEVTAAYGRVKTALETAGIQVKDSFTIYNQLDRLSILKVAFNAIRILLLAVIFPLAGSILAAMVEMAAFKRRREIWTYAALGWKDGNLSGLVACEFWVIALISLVAGTLTGMFTSYLAESRNLWLEFGTLFFSPLRATIGIGDLLVYSGFLVVSVIVWSMPPILRLLRERLFSY